MFYEKNINAVEYDRKKMEFTCLDLLVPEGHIVRLMK